MKSTLALPMPAAAPATAERAPANQVPVAGSPTREGLSRESHERRTIAAPPAMHGVRPHVTAPLHLRRPDNLLALQRSHGNKAVTELVGKLRQADKADDQPDISWDPLWEPTAVAGAPHPPAPPGGGPRRVQRDGLTSGPTTTVGPDPTSAAAAFAVARHLIEAAADGELLSLRADIDRAVEQNRTTGGLITLALGSERIEGFPIDRLPELEPITGRSGLTQREQLRRIQSQVNARLEAERYAREIAQLRDATHRYLAELDEPAPVPGQSGLWLIHDSGGGEHRVTDSQRQAMRAAALPQIRRMLQSAEAWQAVSTSTIARESNPVTGGDFASAQQQAWAAGESVGTAEQQLALGATGRLAVAFDAASAAAEEARAASEAATGAATGSPRMQAAVGHLRRVRDGCIAILGAFITASTGGTAGLVAGTAFTTVAGGAASAWEQAEEREVNWSSLVTSAVTSAVVGIVGGRLTSAVTASLESTISARLTAVLVSDELQPALVEYGRARLADIIGRHVVGRAARVALGQLVSVGSTAASGLATGQTDEQIGQAVADQNTLEAWLVAALIDEGSRHATMLGQRLERIRSAQARRAARSAAAATTSATSQVPPSDTNAAVEVVGGSTGEIRASMPGGAEPILRALLEGGGGRNGAPAPVSSSGSRSLIRAASDWQRLQQALIDLGPRGQAVARENLAQRGALNGRLRSLFRARVIGAASTEAISDVDLQLTGDDAGARVLRAEAWMREQYGPQWDRMWRMSFFTEAGRLTRYTEIVGTLEPAQQAVLRRQLTADTELYTMARMWRYAGSSEANQARVRGMAERAGVDITQVRRLAAQDPSARRGELLVAVDRLQAAYRNTTDATQRAQLAVEITRAQIRANFYTPEAYIGPGAGLQTVLGQRVEGHEAYQAALSHLAEFSHILHEAGNSIAAAARQYELFKYVNRFAEAARQAGIRDARTRFFEEMGAYLYRVDRQAHATGGGTQPGRVGPENSPGWSRAAAGRATAGERSTSGSVVPFANDPSTQVVNDQFLNMLMSDFQTASEGILVELRQRAMSSSSAR